MRHDQIYAPGPCPVCGKPDGAVMGASRWGHDASCCSDRCGFLYAESNTKTQARIVRLTETIRAARAELRALRAASPAFSDAIAHTRRALYHEEEADRFISKMHSDAAFIRRTWPRDRVVDCAQRQIARAAEAWVEAAAHLIADAASLEGSDPT